MNEESKAGNITTTMQSRSSSEEETKMIESGQWKFNETISSSSSEWAPLCQRCSSEDASLIWVNCGNVYLCVSWDDIIHSLGIFESHKRMGVNEFEPESWVEPKNINAEIEISLNSQPKRLTPEAKEALDKLKSKLSYFITKNEEWESQLKNLMNTSNEIEMNYRVSTESIEKSISFLKSMIDNKEEQLKSEILAAKSEKINILEAQKSKILNIQKKIEGVCQVIQEGILQPMFIIETGQKFIDKIIQIWEDKIYTDLANQNNIESSMPKIVDLSPLNPLFSMITFEPEKDETLEEESKIEKVIDTDETHDEDESKAEEINITGRPKIYKGSSFSIPKDKYILKDAKAGAVNYISTAETPNLTKNRSRKIDKKGEIKPLKRTMSSYGGNKDFDGWKEKGYVRGASTSSSRLKTVNRVKKMAGGMRDIGHHSSRYTPKSKDRREDNIHSFVANDNNASLIKQPENSKNGFNSVCADSLAVQIDEEEEKKLIDENPMRKRVFLNVAKTSTSVQVSWSHSNKNKSVKRIQYILEYGVGVKMNGQEQFRMIYKGKAHKWIITDLMPRTAYRFKVVPFKIDDEGKEVLGEWSDIKLINTFDNQDVHPITLGHHASLIMKKQEKWVSFEKQGLITAQYGYSYGVQMWKITIDWYNHYNLYNEDFAGLMHIGVMNSNARSNKIYGATVPYTLQKGKIKIKVLLETEKLRVTVFTSSSSRKGETINDLPKGGIFVPAIFNKTQKNDRNLKILTKFNFEQSISS